MTWRDAVVAGLAARVFRISFSGELAYEINVPSWHGLAIWEAVMAAGEPLGITPYGTEAMHVLRAEKGYVIVGQDTDGSVTPHDLGMHALVSKDKDFLGKRSLTRADTAAGNRTQLVGLKTKDPKTVLEEGAQIVADPRQAIPMTMIGHVSSSYWSENCGRSIALALVKDGRSKVGETLYVPMPDRTIEVEVTGTVFYDETGARLNG
jgi:sarcosine oxidase subunit alpha